MGRKPLRRPLAVYLNGHRAGTLTRDADGATSFAYHPDWLGWEHRFAISLSLPLQAETQRGAGVLAVFDNLLPDDGALRRAVAERMGARGDDPHSLLAAIGRDCVGALQFLPEGSAPGDPFAGRAKPLNDGEIETLLQGLARNPLGLDAEAAFRISVAGAQEKTALTWAEGGWHLPRGLRATTHILKARMGRLQNGIDLTDSLENELFCLRLAQAFGFEVNPARIARFGTTEALVVTRFDRRLAGARLLRLPQEDFCQALGVPSVQKYEADGGPGMAEGLRLLMGSMRPNDDRVTFLAAQLFFWMIGATDGHGKNFSVFLGPGGYRLTPLYDILSAEPARASGQIRQGQMQMAMAVTGRNRHYRIDQIHPRHFQQTGRAAGLGDALIRRAFHQIAAPGTDAIFDRIDAELSRDVPEKLRRPILTSARRRHALIRDFQA